MTRILGRGSGVWAGGLCGLLVVLAGCTPWTLRQFNGLQASRDAYNYVSTPSQPLTITVIDTRTDETVWSTDVPVGKQLSMRFSSGKGTDDQFTPDLLRWDLFDGSRAIGGLDQSVPVPPASARLIDVTTRDEVEPPA